MRFHGIPLDIPHAARISNRINTLLSRVVRVGTPEHENVIVVCNELLSLLAPYIQAEDNPAGEEAVRLRSEAARLGRLLVDALVAAGLTGDRIGQCVRNLFECLELGEEGARISLRAGENPHSLQRP